MEMPRPGAPHEKLNALIGTWIGEETIHPSPWDPQGGQTEARIVNRSALGGFVVEQDYEQRRDGKISFEGRGIFGYDAGELVGRGAHAAIHHSHADGSGYPVDSCPIYGAFRDGAVHHVDDEVFWRKDGKPIRVEYVSTPIYDQNVLVGGVVRWPKGG